MAAGQMKLEALRFAGSEATIEVVGHQFDRLATNECAVIAQVHAG